MSSEGNISVLWTTTSTDIYNFNGSRFTGLNKHKWILFDVTETNVHLFKTWNIPSGTVEREGWFLFLFASFLFTLFGLSRSITFERINECF